MKPAESTGNVMRTSVKQGRGNTKTYTGNRKSEDADLTCYRCGTKGHKSRGCSRRVWCRHCRSNTHHESICKKKGTQDGVRRVAEEKTTDQDQFFKDNHVGKERPPVNVKMKGIMVDGGATSHIVNNIGMFKSFDDSFKPESHAVELADGTKCSVIAQRRGTAVIGIQDHARQQHTAHLREALYVPSYPHNIFSVVRATNVTVTFKKEDSHMVTKDGCRFDIYENGNLFYLPTVEKNVDRCKQCVSHDMKTWHEILGHCNYDDVQKLQGVVKGMEIKGNAVKPAFCQVCTEGKFTQTRNREPDS